MKILFNLEATQPMSGSKIHGGGNYGIVVFFELLKRDIDMECLVNSQKFLREDIADEIEKRDITTYDTNSINLNELLAEKQYDVFYSCLTVENVIVPKSTRFVGTEHGLRDLELPNDFSSLKYKTSVYSKIKFIITFILGKYWKNKLQKRKKNRLLNPNFEFVAVSEHTKYSIISHIPEISEQSIKVFYSPAEDIDVSKVEPYSKDKYILLVSGNRPEKNALRVVKAMDEIISEHKQFSDIKVIIAGATNKTFNYKIKHPDNFILPDYVDEKTLNSLYRGAFLFVYPSINEGFGYPPIEAMRYGIPVIASPITSISEICGDAALYFNPFDYKEIKGRILRLLYNKITYNDYSKKSSERFKIVSARQKEDLNKLVDFIVKDNN